MPWVFSAALFVAHITSSICRIFLKQYDRSQLLAILLAILAVSLTILAYQSTHFEAEKIYIWTPLMVGSDVAALIHLIKEQYPDKDSDYQQVLQHQSYGAKKRKRDMTDIVCTIISALLLVAFIVIQGAGFFFATTQFFRRNQLQLQTTWCSPAFQLGNETFNAECTYLPIIQYETLGVACVSVPGGQGTWLGWTAIGVFILLILELVEMVILFFPCCRQFRVKHHYRAPIATTLAGIVVWVAFIVVGFYQMKLLSPGLSEGRIGIVGDMEGSMCAFDAFPGELRGTIIAWSDGIFGGWSLYQSS
jgi:hypothetical protein